jgi:hypothetical protein
MAGGRTVDKYRVQLDFTPEAFAELDKLKADVQASSRADTVRYAMRILRWTIDQLQQGAKILVSKDGNLAEFVFPFLPQRANRWVEVEPGVFTAEEAQETSAAAEAAYKRVVQERLERLRAISKRAPKARHAQAGAEEIEGG